MLIKAFLFSVPKVFFLTADLVKYKCEPKKCSKQYTFCCDKNESSTKNSGVPDTARFSPANKIAPK